MKGQAFVGLPSEQSAEKALRETNGYVLYDKPLIVVSFYLSPRGGGGGAKVRGLLRGALPVPQVPSAWVGLVCWTEDGGLASPLSEGPFLLMQVRRALPFLAPGEVSGLRAAGGSSGTLVMRTWSRLPP